MRAAWLVRSRQMASDFAFWLAIIGYNRRDRSLSHRIYLVYAVVFFAIWGFAVLSLLASLTASGLVALDAIRPDQAAVTVSLLAILAWGLFQLHRASRRSPLAFSEEDAALICTTPLSRSAVALAWFPENWIASALPFWAGAVTLGFARAEILLQGKTSFADLPTFVGFGLQALLIALPLQMAVLAWVWVAGLYRLKPGRNAAALRWLAPGLAIIWVAAWLAGMNEVWEIVSWPVGFPIQASYGIGLWAAALVYTWILAGAGLIAIWKVARPISLSRAAQETAGRATMQAAALLGNADLARQVQDRERLGSGHAPASLRGRPGAAALAWRQVIQSSRTLRVADLAGWLGVLMASLAIVLFPDWGPRGWGLVVWVILAGQRATSRFRLDLAQWWLFRQIPVPSDRALVVEMVLPWLGITLLTWSALAVGGNMPGELRLAVSLLVPFAAAGVCLGAAYDILRQARVNLLLSETVPDVTALGAAVGLLSCAISAGILYLLGSSGILLVSSTVVALLVECGVVYALWRLTAGALSHLE